MAEKVLLDEILREMRALDNPAAREGMARFGIQTANAIGMTVPQIRKMARRIGRNQLLAQELWQSEIREARILASLVGEPARISPATMDAWAGDFASWDVCDACCCNLFDRTPHAFKKIRKWSGDEREFVRRAAFATIAGLAVHHKALEDQAFLECLPLIERYSFDERNFVRKSVNWALRNIGKRNPALRSAAIECGDRIRMQGTRAARWIAADALRELRGTRPVSAVPGRAR